MKDKRKINSLPGCVRTIFCGILVISSLKLCDGALVDVTDSYMNGVNGGILSAFGDYTNDKATDIFMLSDNKRDIDLIMNFKKGFTRRNLVKALASDLGVITSIMPGDFNGDTFMDILVTRKIGSEEGVSVQIYWTTRLESGQYSVKNSTVLHDKLLDEPLLMDYNGDMIPDLYAQGLDQKRYFWIASTTGKFVKLQQSLPPALAPYHIRSPNSNAFVDLNADLTADLFVTDVDGNDKHKFEVWYSELQGLKYNYSIDMPEKAGKVVGQSTFMDVDADGHLDMLLPVCGDVTCKQSSIWVYSKHKWSLLVDSFANHGVEWGFAPASVKLNTPVTLRVGDFDLDGYPDILAVMLSQNAEANTQQAFILLNVPCVKASCQNVGRTFDMQFQTTLQEYHDVTSATFYDLDENGVMDILVQHYESGTPKLLAFKNGFTQDACFLKVMVISGRCYKSCPGGRPAYSTNQPGISLNYHTTGADGGQQMSMAVQLSQSAHYSLQLPYVVFGLGLTPNFVDNLNVGLPRGVQQAIKQRQWTSIIPNAQMVIIPHPPDRPGSWINKLFVSPFTNLQVLYTAAALLGTCVFVGGIVGGLQWRERAEDKREKLQESQKFHFDAM